MPLRRICEVTAVSPRVLYERIDFFFEQSRAFLAERESKLADADIRRLYIGVDRQEYAINWTRRKDKKNIILSAVASADNMTGYVFGMHTNFDPNMDAKLVEKEALALKDDLLPMPHRKYARLWLRSDYEAAVRVSAKTKASGSLESAIANTYNEASLRPDIESSETMDDEKTLPDYGVLVHAEYTLYGHFMRL